MGPREVKTVHLFCMSFVPSKMLDTLNGITDYGIDRLMGSNLSRMTYPKLLFHAQCMLMLIHSLLSVSY
jgi:hypothetical protein